MEAARGNLWGASALSQFPSKEEEYLMMIYCRDPMSDGKDPFIRGAFLPHSFSTKSFSTTIEYHLDLDSVHLRCHICPYHDSWRWTNYMFLVSSPSRDTFYFPLVPATGYQLGDLRRDCCRFLHWAPFEFSLSAIKPGSCSTQIHSEPCDAAPGLQLGVPRILCFHPLSRGFFLFQVVSQITSVGAGSSLYLSCKLQIEV